MSSLYDFMDAVPAAETHPHHVVKHVDARDFVSHLRAPTNLVRDVAHIPNIKIKFLLSTDGQQPDFIREKIASSEQKDAFTAENLKGLCLNGRRPDPEIFLNSVQMLRDDPTGGLFDEVAWHEYIHGIEGIEESAHGVTRETPWSYRLQRAMLEIDKENNHVPFKGKLSKEFQTYAGYLREGTSLQENVSELFARVGVLFYNRICETGQAITAKDHGYFTPKGFKLNFNWTDRKTYNLSDLYLGLGTYSADAQDLFWDLLPESLEKITCLYGCKPSP